MLISSPNEEIAVINKKIILARRPKHSGPVLLVQEDYSPNVYPATQFGATDSFMGGINEIELHLSSLKGRAICGVYPSDFQLYRCQLAVYLSLDSNNVLYIRWLESLPFDYRDARVTSSSREYFRDFQWVVLRAKWEDEWRNAQADQMHQVIGGGDDASSPTDNDGPGL